MKRTLTLDAERLTELAPGDLADIAGGDTTKTVAATGDRCAVSKWFVSMCGCFTGYCSIDVC